MPQTFFLPIFSFSDFLRIFSEITVANSIVKFLRLPRRWVIIVGESVLFYSKGSHFFWNISKESCRKFNYTEIQINVYWRIKQNRLVCSKLNVWSISELLPEQHQTISRKRRENVGASEACSMSTPAQCHRRVPLFVRRLDYGVIMTMEYFLTRTKLNISNIIQMRSVFRVKFSLTFKWEKST